MNAVLLARHDLDRAALRAAVGCSARACLIERGDGIAFAGANGRIRLRVLAAGELAAVRAAIAEVAARTAPPEAAAAIGADLAGIAHGWAVETEAEEDGTWLLRLAGRLSATVWRDGCWTSARRGRLLPPAP